MHSVSMDSLLHRYKIVTFLTQSTACSQLTMANLKLSVGFMMVMLKLPTLAILKLSAAGIPDLSL